MQTLGSLCTGIGGLDLPAEELYSAELIWVSDIDQHCNEVMKHHRPAAAQLGDFTKVDPAAVEVPDILTMGFPCQSVSYSGKQLGTEDDRWIFDSAVEFLKGLPRLPERLILENVRNLIIHKGGETGLGVLRQVASMGYDIRWGCVRASDAGMPHKRERFFAICTQGRAEALTYSNKQRLERSQHKERRLMSARSDHGLQIYGRYAAAVARWESICGITPPAPTDELGRLNPQLVEWILGFPVGYVTDIIPARTNSLRILGNAVAPAQALLAFKLLEQ